MEVTKELISEVSRVASEINDRCMAAINPTIDSMSDSDPDEKNMPKILGLLIGVRHFLAHAEMIEASTFPALRHYGISKERYEGMVKILRTKGYIEVLKTQFDMMMGEAKASEEKKAPIG